ncbi:DEAD DEAH box helicase [Babesia ovis]|uniref:DEAD DEAH box helicase n=1 Tax=Babesia ovis TaxID=5869 RepID=A0A9W5WTY9_BABOV|nr:DEAD DEAH box helicase [Babesia ovis]
MARRVPLSVYDRLSCGSFGSRPLIQGYRRRQSLNIPAVETQPGRVEDAVVANNTTESPVHGKVKLHPMLRLALLRSRGISQLNETQESSFMSILSGKDVTIHAPIGSGKTLAYLLPIVNNIYNIHDLLEDLQLRHANQDLNVDTEENKLRHNALGYSRHVRHALLPRSMADLSQDPSDLQRSAAMALESQSTAEKLVDTLYKIDPRKLKRSAQGLPQISRRLWGRRSRSSIFRALMSNPLGSIRCCVIVVPNKDLVAQVLNEISAIDPLGRISVQTLTQVHSVPPKAEPGPEGTLDLDLGKQPFYPSPHTLYYLSDTPQKINLSYEDERQMIQNIPTVAIPEVTVKTVPINRGKAHATTHTVRSSLDTARYDRNLQSTSEGSTTALDPFAMQCYSVDGLIPRNVEYVKRPIMRHPVIQYGSCDIVVTTPHLFLNDILSSYRNGVVPACVVFDEVDTLLENNTSRSAMMELCSMLRPRPKMYHPLVNRGRPRPPRIPPCQFIKVASTINYGGMQTAGSMLYERFTTSTMVSAGPNHHIRHNLRYLQVDADFETKLRVLMETLVASPYAKTLIFADNIEHVRRITQLLRSESWPVMCFHSRSSLATRLGILETYKSEDVSILVSTDLLSRGIDIYPDHVIYFSFPRDAATFLHRAKGHPTVVTALVEPKDQVLAAEIYRAYRLGRPISHLFSRKRSLAKRKKALSSGYAPKLQSFNSLSTKGLTDNVDDMPKAQMDQPTQPRLGCKAHQNMDTITRQSVSTGDQDRIYADKDAVDVRYRRRNAKSRGIEFYNNFNEFS